MNDIALKIRVREAFLMLREDWTPAAAHRMAGMRGGQWAHYKRADGPTPKFDTAARIEAGLLLEPGDLLCVTIERLIARWLKEVDHE